MKSTNSAEIKRSRSPYSGVALFCTLIFGLGSPLHAQDAEFYALGDLPGGNFESWGLGVSNDGQIVAGVGKDGNVDAFTGFLWSPETGMTALGDTSDGVSAFVPQRGAISPDGKFLVGRVRDLDTNDYQAFLWSDGAGFELLGHIAGGRDRSVARGVSSNGEVVVGYGMGTEDKQVAFRWTRQTGMVALSPLTGDSGSVASGISGDSHSIVGQSVGDGVGGGPPVLWIDGSAPTSLGSLLAEEQRGWAVAASRDGSVIVGDSASERTQNLDAGYYEEAFRWTADEGIHDLGDYPVEIVQSRAYGVSADGRVIVGWYGDPAPGSVLGYEQTAMIWTEKTGVLQLQNFLVENGAQGLEGWRLGEASGISSNGQWVVGWGENPEGNNEAFLARLSSDLMPRFQINAGLNDAWYSPTTVGQGFLMSVFPDIQQIFVAWFTYDTERPDQDVEAILGDPGHRWLTAQGPYTGDTASLTIYVTEGGVFDAAAPPAQNDGIGDGTMTIEFADCAEGLVTYEINSPNLSGEIPIERIADDNVLLCESLSGQ